MVDLDCHSKKECRNPEIEKVTICFCQQNRHICLCIVISTRLSLLDLEGSPLQQQDWVYINMYT